MSIKQSLQVQSIYNITATQPLGEAAKIVENLVRSVMVQAIKEEILRRFQELEQRAKTAEASLDKLKKTREEMRQGLAAIG